MLNAVRDYLKLFDGKTAPEERNPEQLARVLDQLLTAYHGSVDVSPTTDIQPPSQDHREIRGLMERCFPGFGLYGWSAPEEIPGDEVMMCDAINDLADIYAELSGVMWLSENSGKADAIWQFRFGFQSHWGRHLLNLRSYLHWYLYEQ